MGLLRSYSYHTYCGVDEIPEEVLRLFYEPMKNGKKIDYPSEIVFAALKGKIDLKRPFYMDAYVYGIKSKHNLKQLRNKEKELHIDNCSSDDYSQFTREGGIPEEHLCVKDLIDAFDQVVDDEELVYAVSQIKNLNKELVVVEEVDIIEALKLAVKGFVGALSEVKRVCEFYPQIAEYVKVVLQSGKNLNEVFA